MSESVGIDPHARSRGEIIRERNTVVPPWAPPIHDFTVRVKIEKDGKVEEIPPGFTIGDVAPEYRWAIDPDTGIVMSQAEFLQQFDRWYAAHYTMKGHQVEGEALSIPGVVEFVSKRVHPDDPTKVIPMDCDLYRPVTSQPKTLYDRDGDPYVESRYNPEAENSASKMDQLKRMHDAGDITDEVFIKRSKEIYGGSVVVGGGDADSAEPIPAGSPPPPGFEAKPEERKPDPPPATTFVPDPEPSGVAKARCGKEVNAAYVSQHQGRCLECRSIKEREQEG